MKHRVLTAIAFLLLGAIVNVGVAWGLCLSCSPGFRSVEPVDSQTNGVVNFVSPGVTTQVVLPNTTLADPTAVLLIKYLRHTAAEAGNTTVTVEAICGRGLATLVVGAGWPLEAVQGRADIHGLSHGMEMSQSSIAVELKGREETRLLPFGPTWPGFAINTVFYAVLLWLLFAAPFALRRRRRIRRGLCPKCAYPVGDSRVCTECGKPLKSSHVVSAQS